MSIESIRARVAGVTPGPWEDMHPPGDPRVKSRWHPGAVAIVCGAMAYRHADADFIAHARQDIPALLAVAEAAANWLRMDAYEDPIEPEEWDPRAAAVRDALAALEATP